MSTSRLHQKHKKVSWVPVDGGSCVFFLLKLPNRNLFAEHQLLLEAIFGFLGEQQRYHQNW